jgi:23S rRNA (uracil1939-C5)-methyltransferase
MNREVVVDIQSMAFRGYGVARVEGKVLFIPYSVSGEKVRVEIVQEKKDYSIGRLKEIVAPSPRRVNPPCPYFGVCGGCHWQHIDYAFHGGLKKEILGEILQRIGRIREIPPISVVPAPDPYDYRVRVQLKVDGNRMGYFQERSHHIVDIDHCPISHPLVNELIFLFRKEFPRPYQMEEIEIDVSPEEGKGVLLLHPLPVEAGVESLLKAFLQTHPILKAVALVTRGKSILVGDPRFYFTVSVNHREKKKLRLGVSPESFSQVNPEQNRKLIQTVLEFSEVKKDETVLDLYSGIGNFTLPLAVEAGKVFGIEDNRKAVEDARFNAERNGIECRFIPGRVEEVLENWARERPDLIVLDPPRTGCKTILDQVVRLKPRKMVYVSCEPTTFSRDLRLFSERGYKLERLSLIDMFPQSYHMEVVGLLTKNPISKLQIPNKPKIPISNNCPSRDFEN